MQDAWSVVKERSLLSVAPYNFTGMFTRPNAIAPLHRARAMNPNLPGFGMKDRGAINDLSAEATLFKVDPNSVQRERAPGRCPIQGTAGPRPVNMPSGNPNPTFPVAPNRNRPATRISGAAAPRGRGPGRKFAGTPPPR